MNEKTDICIVASPEACGEAGTVSAMIFSTLCFLFWANGLGLLGSGATIAMAAFQLGAAAMYAYGGITHIKRGESFFGNVYIIFSVFFGAGAGALNLVGAIAEIKGFAYSWAVEGLMFLFVGIVVLAFLPHLVTWAISFFGIFLTGGLACVCWGIVYLGLLPGAAVVLNLIGSWSVFACGLLGTYTVLSTMFSYIGVKMDFLSWPLVAPKK